MRYRYQLMLLGFALFIVAALHRGWTVPVVWLGGDFVALGIAHWTSSHRVLGKRDDGTISPWAWVVFLPYLIVTVSIWHILRLLTAEPAFNPVTDDLVIGRRLLSAEIPAGFENYIDLTAEFPEAPAIRRSSAYFCFPILDGSAPTPQALHAAVSALRPGRTFIHCAQGHGRTGLFALAILLSRGAVGSVQDGLSILRLARPGVHLNRSQLSCIEAYAKRST